ncbi:hypothetical protein ANANG_G00251720 [Anguilla anguilla]|uniref:Uncharacterized protein n=1 Tax=Anguilla anguilla TaxID=7936 RepID=A0A9D3LW00_ANGAN|nr:hypothetical protein ANANG_G00251720 [Anguilla anguilla]
MCVSGAVCSSACYSLSETQKVRSGYAAALGQSKSLRLTHSSESILHEEEKQPPLQHFILQSHCICWQIPLEKRKIFFALCFFSVHSFIVLCDIFVTACLLLNIY